MAGDVGRAGLHPQQPLGEGPPAWALSHRPRLVWSGSEGGRTVGRAGFGVQASLLTPDLESEVEENICLENPKGSEYQHEEN